MATLNTRHVPKPATLPPQGGAPPQQFEPSNTLRTHEGAPAARIPLELQLRRSVCSCMLWESEFYENGKTIANRIQELALQVAPGVVAGLAYDARKHFHLRHVPLLLCSILAKTGSGSKLVSETLAETISRPDEISEFLTIYARVNGVEPKDVKKKMSAQVKKGLAAAFTKFDQYQLAKYFSQSGEKEAAVRGRDVLFLSHAKPLNEEQTALFKKIAAKEPIKEGGADTWEVELSRGSNKMETFTRLLQEDKLGYMAVLRNLRNMDKAGVDRTLVEGAILSRRGARRVLPFRFIAAARACPQYTDVLNKALIASLADTPSFSDGPTVVLVDVSSSMHEKLSSKSDLNRMDAAATLGAVIGGSQVYSFSNNIVPVPEASGISGIENIIRSQMHGGTYLGGALNYLNEHVEMERLIVVTDEQAHDHVIPPVNARRCYLINVASAQNGVGYGERWMHIDGFSEQVIRFIHEMEKLSPLL